MLTNQVVLLIGISWPIYQNDSVNNNSINPFELEIKKFF